ncbi:hypothetical protein CFC21_016661 [Triticum aestivum]|uniref:Uncharacterized protein n=3 Tax=Triticum TaxID=4564 RepID=A0A9R1NRE7_TRITD|nr:hypothetical protein CFC21_016661 [Triticum aestivum]VAH29765.1 unnamed protein product [Triticum turgidum subsp. durum]
MEQPATAPATSNAIRGAMQRGNIAKQRFARKDKKMFESSVAVLGESRNVLASSHIGVLGESRVVELEGHRHRGTWHTWVLDKDETDRKGWYFRPWVLGFCCRVAFGGLGGNHNVCRRQTTQIVHGRAEDSGAPVTGRFESQQQQGNRGTRGEAHVGANSGKGGAASNGSHGGKTEEWNSSDEEAKLEGELGRLLLRQLDKEAGPAAVQWRGRSRGGRRVLGGG